MRHYTEAEILHIIRVEGLDYTFSCHLVECRLTPSLRDLGRDYVAARDALGEKVEELADKLGIAL